MHKWLLQTLTYLLQIVRNDGIDLIRIRTVTSLIRIIAGLRRLLLLNYLILITCFLNAFSLFSSIYLLANQLSEQNHFELTWTIGYCLGLFALSSMILALTLREKIWIQAFRIEELVDSALSLPKHTSTNLQAEEITRIVEQILASKFSKANFEASNQ